MIDCVFVEIRFQQTFLRNLKLLRGHGVTVGREVGDLVFAQDLEMSGTHFRIEVEGNDCRVTDLQSTNSTWLNESKIESALISDNDEVRAGNTAFRFQIQNAIPTVRPGDTASMPLEESNPVDPPSPIEILEVESPTDPTEDSWDALLQSADNPDTPGKAPHDSVTTPHDPVREFADTNPEATLREKEEILAAPVQLEIVLLQGNAPQERYVIDTAGNSQITIGREGPVDFQVNDEKVSALHCQILESGRWLVIRDLDSTNGTRINGQEITEARISDGDELQIGDTRLAIRISYDR